jgi:tryptophan synthase beta chain
MSSDLTKIPLSEAEMPHRWYNIQADLPKPLPPSFHPATLQPLTPPDLIPLFPIALLQQEMSQERYIDIPEEVFDIYRLWRPTPLLRARRLEKALGTPAHIYYKYEGASPVGSHKPNTAVAQAYYNKKEGTRRLATETGAGQWGSALAMAGRMMGLEVTVYMVKVSFQQKPYRRLLMETYGATVHASPSEVTDAGRRVLAAHPNSTGSLGIAISEAVEDAAKHEDTKYSLGSVLNHVLLHQTVIGEECIAQLSKIDDYPDIVIGCCGGGSNLGGVANPFLRDKLTGKKPNLRVIAVEPAACPTLTKGKYLFDFGDSVGLGPMVKMYTLGHDFVPEGIHAGGLRYHGDSPIISALYDEGIIEAVAYHQNPVFAAAMQFVATEGLLPAPESAHAIKAAVDEAIKCRESGEKKVILFNLSGHGNFDLTAYDDYLRGNLVDTEYSSAEVEQALAGLPQPVVV